MSRSDRLRLGLLQCGNIPAVLVPDHGDYPEAFSALLAGHDVDLVTYDVQSGHLPGGPSDCDGWLVSGSASSAYEPLGWIPGLEGFLRRLVDAESPTVAICFGHQALAQAMGGRVARAPKGWGVGAHDYSFAEPTPDWMVPPPNGTVRMIASHQDQVVELPDDAVILAQTDHCPVAAYSLGSSALAIQPHPEFGLALSAELIRLRSETLGPELTESGLRSLEQPLDSGIVADWMVAFLRR